MTDDNKKTPTDDKITELSAWQKRNKEYLEKKALEKAEEAETEETESEETQEDEDLSEKETASCPLQWRCSGRAVYYAV